MSLLPVLDSSQAADMLARAEAGDMSVSDEILRAILRADASLSLRAMSVLGARKRASRSDPSMIVIRGVIQTGGRDVS